MSENSAPDEYKRSGDDLKGKPLADKVISELKPLPRKPLPPPEKAKKK